MRHEYISYIWFRKIDPFHFRYAKRKDKYVPKEAHLSEFCYCGFKLDENEAKCFYCSLSLSEAVSRSAQKGELDDEICNMRSVSS